MPGRLGAVIALLALAAAMGPATASGASRSCAAMAGTLHRDRPALGRATRGLALAHRRVDHLRGDGLLASAPRQPEQRELDRGPVADIPSRSLKVTGRTVSWTHGAEQRSATL